MAAWGPRGDYEFFALTMACNGILRASTRPGTLPEPGGMQSLQSMDGSALGLHSCRAQDSTVRVEKNWSSGYPVLFRSNGTT